MCVLIFLLHLLKYFLSIFTMVVADHYHFVTIDQVSELLPEEEIEDFLPFGYLSLPSSFYSMHLEYVLVSEIEEGD